MQRGDVRLPECYCLKCKQRLYTTTPMQTGDVPSPGAITVCDGCAHVMAWDDRMRLRELTPDEAEQLKDHPQIKAAIRVIKILRSHTMLEG